MKKLLALILAVAIVGVVSAQDLDCPKTGTAQSQQVQQQSGSSAFEQLIANILRTEADYIARVQTREDIWLRWGVGVWATWDTNHQYYPEAWALWEQLSPAEYAAAQAEFRASWQRVIAAGLN